MLRVSDSDGRQGSASTPIRDVSPDATSEVLPFTYSITAYGADYPVDGLVKRINSGDIVVPTFQRSYVWKRYQADRFIESLLLGLPVPGLFLAQERDTRRLIVVDGQQRLETLRRYYSGRWDEQTVFALRNAQQRLRGLTYSALAVEDRRRMDDAILHATIIRQDEPSDDQSSIYFVFERLNTSGTTLHPQEIRNSIYRGSFRDLLEELNANLDWRAIYGPEDLRYKDRELILRFLAMMNNRDNYSQPMKGFLNNFMGLHRSLDVNQRVAFAKSFNETIATVRSSLGDRAFRLPNALNVAIFDAVMVGVADRLRLGPIDKPSLLRQRYLRLLEEPAFRTATTRSTANEDNVRQRMKLAIAAMRRVR